MARTCDKVKLFDAKRLIDDDKFMNGLVANHKNQITDSVNSKCFKMWESHSDFKFGLGLH